MATMEAKAAVEASERVMATAVAAMAMGVAAMAMGVAAMGVAAMEVAAMAMGLREEAAMAGVTMMVIAAVATEEHALDTSTGCK